MNRITLGELRQVLVDRMADDDQAKRLLDAALGDTGLPVQESYSPQEIVAIGMAIAERSQRELEASPLFDAGILARAFGPWIAVLKEETGKLPHL